MSHRATITITTRALTICFANCTWQNEMDSTLSHVYLYMDVYWIDWLVRVAGNIFYILTIKFIKEIFYLYIIKLNYMSVFKWVDITSLSPMTLRFWY